MTDSSEDFVAQQGSSRAAFWRNWREVVLSRSGPQVTPIAPMPPIAPEQAPATDLDYLAHLAEGVRERCLDVITRADQLAALRQDLVGVFAEVGKILKETEGTSSALIHRTALLAHEEEEHENLKALYHALKDESQRHAHENALLRAEIERSGDLVSAREARIQALEEDLAKAREEIEQLRKALEQGEAARIATAEKLDEAVRDLARQEETISAHIAQIAELSDRNSIAELRSAASENSLLESQSLAKRLRDSLIESQQEAAGLALKLETANGEVARLQTKIKDADSALVAAKVAQQVAETVWRERDQRTGDEIERLNKVASAEQARAEAGDAQLAAARAELQEAAAKLRMKEREAEHLGGRIAPLEQRIKSATDEIGALNEKLAEGERSRAALADRAQAIVRAMSDLKAKLEVAEERAQQYESRLASDAVGAAVDREQLERRIHALTESLEREKAAHLMAASALTAARSRLGREWEIEPPREVLVEAARTQLENDQHKLAAPSPIEVGTFGVRPKIKRARRRAQAREAS